MKADALVPSKIKITDFKIVKGQIESPFDFDNAVIEEYDFNLNYDVGFNFDDKLAKTDFQVFIATQSEHEQEEATGSFHFAFVFSVENLEELIQQKGRKTVIHHSLANALASITYSTSRGILMTRFQGTVLNNFILPVINPNSLFN